eukprot:CAMPEP_0181320752 /NCGR_PEP_ID=MMETSP1101-20121128/18295_1 /TAXON_ID=46948 /ORGANISM="Rhodomonas abbreviata, Strain Caron Lab Isolate" /LENGTH=139 /DNA_ID=CAMNT_0023428485 /DNA_START=128 /DNA_END=544 /DNA_ORIENTATION=+
MVVAKGPVGTVESDTSPEARRYTCIPSSNVTPAWKFDLETFRAGRDAILAACNCTAMIDDKAVAGPQGLQDSPNKHFGRLPSGARSEPDDEDDDRRSRGSGVRWTPGTRDSGDPSGDGGSRQRASTGTPPSILKAGARG